MTKDEALKLVRDWIAVRPADRPVSAGKMISIIDRALAQPAQEPVAWITPDGEGFRIRFSAPTSDVPLGWDALYTTPPLPVQERNFCPRCGKRTADLTTIHTCTPPKNEAKTADPFAAGSQAFYGFPNEPVSTPNAGGKCVTAGETAPDKEIDPNQWAFDRGLEST
jgi:hypothetical protein